MATAQAPKLVPMFRPLIEEEEILAAVESLQLGWLGMGSYVGEFEDAVAEVCGLDTSRGRNVVAVSTGHAALHLALDLIGVGPGDEVITPSFNNAADFQAIRACGADPVFVDIDNENLCIDVEKVEELISDKTKCIIAMDYDVFTCDHEALAAISISTGIPVLHDAAHSFGSSRKGVPIGNQHPYTMFSFDPVKTVTCIDGGALLVDDEDLVDRLHAKRLLGMTQPVARMYQNSRAWTYDVRELGYRYHLANLHAAVGLAQIKKLQIIRESRQYACRRYSDGLSSLDWVDCPDSGFSEVNPFLYYIRVPRGERDELRRHMDSRGVESGIHWQAGHSFSFFQNCRHGDLSVTERVVSEVLSLPLHSCMSNDDIDRVIDAVRSFR